jgi:general secretion pathway protein L
MAQRILGLDLGARSVKAVLLEGTFRGFTVAAARRVPLGAAEAGAPPAARHAAAVRALLEDRAFAFDVATVAFPGAGVSSNVVTLPFSDPRRIEQTIGFEVEGQIPFDLADVAWDWQPLGVRDGQADLLVAVVRKEELGALLAALGEAGVDPRAVLPAGPAYASLFAAGVIPPAPRPEGAPPGTELLVDVGLERTSVTVISAGACEAARTFAFGTAQLARALGRELGIAEAEGDLLVAAAAGGPPLPPELEDRAADPRAADALRRGLAPLVREVRATVRTWRARVGQRPLERLLLAGEAARLPALAEELAAEGEGPVAPVALAGPGAEAIAPEDAPAFALALSLALRAQQGSRAPRLNLRRGELAYTRDFQHLKGRIARLAFWGGLVLLLGFASAGVKAFALSRQEAALDRALCDAQQRIIGRCYPNFEEAQAVLRGRGTPGAALPRVSAVDLFAELADRTPADVPLRFERIEVTKDKLHLQGTTDAAENVDRIVAALKGSRCFGDARSGGARRRGTEGKFEFSIDAALTCLETGRETPGGRP